MNAIKHGRNRAVKPSKTALRRVRDRHAITYEAKRRDFGRSHQIVNNAMLRALVWASIA